MVHRLIKLPESNKELFQSSIEVPNCNGRIVNLPEISPENTINNTGKTTKLSINNTQQSTNSSCNINLNTRIPMNNKVITTELLM